MNKSKKIVAIIQARMGSTRLPNKVLMDIAGKPMLWHILNRLKYSKLINEIVIATTTKGSDDSIEAFCKKNSVFCFRGNEEDVLERYYQAASMYKAKMIVRITADCPLIDPKIVDLVIERHIKSEADYTSNTIKRTYPRGLDTEIFNYNVLKKAYNQAKAQPEREHVTIYFYRHPEIFKLESVEAQAEFYRPDIRICVDTQEDLQLVRKIFEEFSDKEGMFLAEDIIDLCSREPQILKINSAVQQKVV